MNFVNIGFGNLINAERVVAVVSFQSAPAKRLAQESKEMGRCIDATCGRKTKSVIVTDSEHIILSSVLPATICQRLNSAADEEETENEKNE